MVTRHLSVHKHDPHTHGHCLPYSYSYPHTTPCTVTNAYHMCAFSSCPGKEPRWYLGYHSRVGGLFYYKWLPDTSVYINMTHTPMGTAYLIHIHTLTPHHALSPMHTICVLSLPVLKVQLPALSSAHQVHPPPVVQQACRAWLSPRTRRQRPLLGLLCSTMWPSISCIYKHDHNVTHDWCCIIQNSQI